MTNELKLTFFNSSLQIHIIYLKFYFKGFKPFANG